ncbi:MAG: FixH family protein [Candidatus Velthaea sp.]
MIKSTSIAFAIAILASPVVASAADAMKMTPHGGLRVSATFNPSPARQGSEVITIAVKDAAGKPVKGATVKVASTMPTMSMTGPTVSAPESKTGIYTAKINLNFATTWRFDVTAAGGRKSGTTQLSADVK